MNFLKQNIFLGLVLSFLFMMQACGGGGGSSSDSSSSPDPDLNATPEIPNLGGQIDRAGRVLISTALIETFNSNDEIQEREKDAYNASDNSEDTTLWSSYTSRISGDSLPIYDGLGICGNQFLTGEVAELGRYNALARVLADDKLYLDSSIGVCNGYLSLEAGIEGDCGGRNPLVDTIDVTYSLLTIGTLGNDVAEGRVSDGIPSDDAQHSMDEFPFLADPI